MNAKDDALRLFERLLKTQRKFKANGLPSKVDIGYHYTEERNMKTIQTSGLLTRAERTSKRIFPTSNGIFFGDGIYTANHPSCNKNQRYGNVGLIVARLQGESVRVLDDKKKGTEEANTVIGNKGAVSLSNWPATDRWDEIVLKSSAQCVPVVRFDSAIVFIVSAENSMLLSSPTRCATSSRVCSTKALSPLLSTAELGVMNNNKSNKKKVEY